MSRRLPQTLADYLVVGISPALITLLVGSLMFFLVEVFYQGQFYHRLLWVLACFVVATVGIARISMEEGTAYASMFGIPLAIAVGLATLQFVKIEGPLADVSPLINWSLMGLVWWCSHKLTWDCTLIDDSQDASGQGLLQSIGWDHDTDPAGAGSTEPASSGPTDLPPTQQWWQKWLAPDKRPHAAGVWVIYFSLAALPLFGIGQWFIPVENLASRRYVFWLLVVYAASGLGLLLTTSFLGLRRYLRQRRLEMPPEMAATWLAVGGTMIVVLLLLVALLPRPSPEYSLVQLAPRFIAPDREASRYGGGEEGTQDNPQPNPTAEKGQEKQPNSGAGQGEAGKAPGKQGNSEKSHGGEAKQGQGSSSDKSSTKGQQPPDSQSSDKGDQSKSAKQPSGEQGSSQPKNSSSNDATQPTPTPEGKTSDPPSTEPEKKSPPESSPPQSAPPQSPPAAAQWLDTLSSWLGTAIKWLFFAIVLAVVAYVAWQNRAELAVGWQQLLQRLREFLARFLGGQAVTTIATPEVAPTVAPPPAFASFVNPFATGRASKVAPAELVRYTFAALEAWGRERNSPRSSGQTPHEFAQQLGQLAPGVAPEVHQLAEIYCQLAYAKGQVSTAGIEPLRQLWHKLGDLAAQPA